MIILGIDPGTRITGYGFIQKNGRGWRHLDCGLIPLKAKDPLPNRLHSLFQKICSMIEQFRPDEIALEDLFFAKNAQSALKLGHARGVVMLTAAQYRIPVFEYPPAQIKMALSGFGRANKEQMQKMVKIHLQLKEIAEENASDALAVALCHSQTRRLKK